MLTEISDYSILKEKHRSVRSSIYQGIHKKTQRRVVIKLINQEYPSIEEVARFRNEYRVTKMLNLPGVVKAYDLEKHENRLALIMEDFGGENLASFISNGMSIELFLPIAIQIAEVLGTIHQQQVIHRDINPSNILWNPKTQTIKLIDFGISTELSQERKDDIMPKMLEGSLPYISPEQTGRMNRDVDYLTDYYSLGATFFEMLTGKYPFEANDIMEWVYSHITKIPKNPSQLNPEIPEMLSDIVLKLMAKNPEDRYQSTCGLINDLDIARKQWFEKGTIDPFMLGKSDFSEKFFIPQKLYGREKETEILLNIFNKTAQSQSEFLLIAGYSGVGKTVLVNEIRIPILQKNGYFIEGKNDQLQQNIPYNAVKMAFSGLIRQLLTEPRDRLTNWKNKLLGILKPNAQIIIDIIPEFEKIIGKQPPVQTLPPTEAQNRFIITFRNFVKVFATREHPLVIFLDNLQWTDTSTLNLVVDLLTQDSRYLFLIGSYRNNEVNERHPLMLTLDEIQKSRSVNRLFLKPLENNAVNQIVRECLHCSANEVQALSKLIFQKTNGNPFFVKEFLKDLYEEDLIGINRAKGLWHWDFEKIRAIRISDNVVEFIIKRLKKLPEEARQTLQLASCIGNQFDINTLSLISEKPLPLVAKILWKPIEQRVLIPMDERYRLIQTLTDKTNEELSGLKIHYKFAHDRIQQAFYSLIDDDKKQSLHLSIGRLLLQKSNTTEIEDKLVDILFQLNRGKGLITAIQEKQELAQLNLKAARKAKSSTAYQAAYQYLKIGLELLPADSWDVRYELIFDLAKEFSECAYLCGEFKEADQQCQILLDRAKTSLEKAEIYRMQSLQYTIRGELKTAIRMAIRGLNLLGVKLAYNPNPFSIARELLRARLNRGNRKVAELANQPTIADPKLRTCMKMMIELGAPAYLTGNERLFTLAALKGLNIVLKNGNTPEAPMAYVSYGFLLGSVFGLRKIGYEFGKLGLELNERLNNIELKSRIIFFYAVFIHAFNQPWKTIPIYLKSALEAGYQSGDLFYFAYSCVQMIPWNPSIDLKSAMKLGEQHISMIKETKYEDAWYFARLLQQGRLNFRGLTNDKFSLSSDSFDEMEWLERNKKTGYIPGIAIYHSYKVQIHYLFEDFHSAIFHVEKADKAIQSLFGLPYTVEYCLFAFLAHAGNYPTLSGKDKKQAWKRLGKEYRQMKKWANHCPGNFLHHQLIMEAELARLTNDFQPAVNALNRSITVAHENGFIRYQALANELAAKLLLAQNQNKIARIYLKDALYCYELWGALAKVNQLKEKYAQLITPENAQPKESETLSGLNVGEHQILDLATISKASQTLSGEVVLEKLLNKLMYIVRENAGAEKGLLLLKEELSQELLIQAESIGDEDTQVLQGQSLEDNPRLCVAIVQYVARSLENVVLKDASQQGDFIHDVYIREHRPKSILSMPIINQGLLVGVLYLENNVTTDAFTPDRLNLLGLLSSQAAISIQNAILYRTMEQKVSDRTRAIKDLLDNTGQGFLTFDQDFKIHKQYSRACELFFGRALVDSDLKQEKGIDFLELINQQPEERVQIKKILNAVFSGKVALEAICQFLPDEITIGTRVLSLEYNMIPAYQLQTQDRIMVILTDITREKALAFQLEQDEERNAVILKIVKNRQGYLNFCKLFSSHMRNIETCLNQQVEDIDIDSLFRYFHTIKGGAASFDLKILVKHTYGIESILETIRRGEREITKDMTYQLKLLAIQLEQLFQHLSDDLSKFVPEDESADSEPTFKISDAKISNHRAFLLENLGITAEETVHQSIRLLCKQPIDSTLRDLKLSAHTLAKELGKKVEVITIGNDVEVLIDQLTPLLNVLVHLIRNAVDHGIESTDERLSAEKPETGIINIKVIEIVDQLCFVFSDDGRGIDINKISDIALKKGLVADEWQQSASADEKLELVFTPGFSSAGKPSTTSGRGVGMDAVKTAVDELNGNIKISTELGKGTTITILIPYQ